MAVDRIRHGQVQALEAYVVVGLGQRARQNLIGRFHADIGNAIVSFHRAQGAVELHRLGVSRQFPLIQRLAENFHGIAARRHIFKIIFAVGARRYLPGSPAFVVLVIELDRDALELGLAGVSYAVSVQVLPDDALQGSRKHVAARVDFEAVIAQAVLESVSGLGVMQRQIAGEIHERVGRQGAVDGDRSDCRAIQSSRENNVSVGVELQLRPVVPCQILRRVVVLRTVGLRAGVIDLDRLVLPLVGRNGKALHTDRAAVLAAVTLGGRVRDEHTGLIGGGAVLRTHLEANDGIRVIVGVYGDLIRRVRNSEREALGDNNRRGVEIVVTLFERANAVAGAPYLRRQLETLVVVHVVDLIRLTDGAAQ